MLILRIIGVLTAIAIAAGIFAYLLTRERRYLALSARIAKYALIVALVILALMFLERIVVI